MNRHRGRINALDDQGSFANEVAGGKDNELSTEDAREFE